MLGCDADFVVDRVGVLGAQLRSTRPGSGVVAWKARFSEAPSSIAYLNSSERPSEANGDGLWAYEAGDRDTALKRVVFPNEQAMLFLLGLVLLP